MIYLIDDMSISIPIDATSVVFIGDITELDTVPEAIERLQIEEQCMLDFGAKVQLWHERNNFCPFKLLTRRSERYGNSVAKHHFITID